MPTPEAVTRLAQLFPTAEAIPASADFAPGGGSYGDGTLYLVDGEVRRWTGETSEVHSPVCVDGGRPRSSAGGMGAHAALTSEEALAALDAAVRAWDHGRGRVADDERRRAGRGRATRSSAGMEKVREESVRLLMWEIGKTRADSEKEFDRTVQYVRDTVEALKELDRAAGRFRRARASSRRSAARRSASVLCMGPFNYPLNETFTTLDPGPDHGQHRGGQAAALRHAVPGAAAEGLRPGVPAGRRQRGERRRAHGRRPARRDGRRSTCSPSSAPRASRTC